MSTRCMIKFGDGRRVEAKIYRHSDGYPDSEHGVLADFQRFFEAVEAQTFDTRFGDAEYLAAKFLVWATQDLRAGLAEFRKETGRGPDEKDGPLNFLSYGVSMHDHGDIEYVYFVDCSRRDVYGRPLVLWRKAHEKKLHCPRKPVSATEQRA